MNECTRQKKLVNDRFDLTGISIVRIIKHFFLSRFIPMGNFAGGPRLKPILLLFFVHYAGQPLFWFTTRFERQMILLYRLLSKFRNA